MGLLQVQSTRKHCKYSVAVICDEFHFKHLLNRFMMTCRQDDLTDFSSYTRISECNSVIRRLPEPVSRDRHSVSIPCVTNYKLQVTSWKSGFPDSGKNII
jgi:hypothetical protein